MLARCKVCGRPLRDPISIARGMGRKCAGISNSRKSFHPIASDSRETSYVSTERHHAGTDPLSFGQELRDKVPETLRRYPPDLVNLVLSAPATGSIAAGVKLYSRHRQNADGVHPAKLLKQIRRMCIEFRLLFWPGLSKNLEPMPCIPCGDNDWKIGENGRVCTKDELVSYLTRYGIISSQQVD